MQTGQSDNGAVSRVAMIPVEFEIFDPSLDVYRENIETVDLFQFIGEFLNGNRYGELKNARTLLGSGLLASACDR